MINEPTQNKMMEAAPDKKGWHFPSDGIHFAEHIYAETLAEATAIYHKIKRPMSETPPAVNASHDALPATSPPSGEDINQDITTTP